jgi:NAD-dependent DNA ligase
MTKQELEKLVEEANMAYSAGMPFITDQEYDVLWQALYAVDPENHLLYHTAQAYNQVHGKSWHKHQIFGTNKAFNMEDLTPFLMRFGNQQLVIEPKYDGCAAIVTMEKSGLKITLEGDGKCGSDVTHLLPYIKFPFQLRNFQAVELLLPVAEWNPEYGKNPRNVVAGWLARKYEEPGAEMTALPHGFGDLHIAYFYDGNLDSLGELLIRTHAEWSKIYPIDGLMVKLKDEKARLIAGNNGTTSNWSIAWKPPIQIKKTIVTDIEWNVSRLGRVIPTVIYLPIDLCGTTNSRVTGNNAKWLADKNIKIGSNITVGKAGEIIPKIIDVEESDVDLILPQTCPTCGDFLHWDGVHLKCNGTNCIAQKIVSIAYFYSHKGIKVDGIGEAMIEKLLNNQQCYSVLVNSPWALLDMFSYDIMHPVIAVLGETIFSNIINELNAINDTKNMSHFIAGLGLQGLAYKSAIKLCQYIKTGKLTNNVPAKARENFAQAVMIYQEAVSKMQVFKFADIPSPAKAKYCITGTLSMSRETMIELLNDYSFEFSATVTMDTNYLIVGDEAGKTKINKAEKYDIPQITEAQLMKIIKEKSNG